MFLRLFFLISTLLIIKPLYAHTFTGMNGFYDGLSHPVLGLDHFLAMVCVGVVSSQIGGKAIWTVPSLFVLFMIVGGAAGLFIEILAITFSDIIEWGIIFSVIFLGLSVAIEKKITNYYYDGICCYWDSHHGLRRYQQWQRIWKFNGNSYFALLFLFSCNFEKK